jgi:predicted nucleic acid-binding protein
LKAYLDTNILIDYIWSASSEEEEKKSPSYALVNKGAMGEYEIFISFYTLMEVHQHFTDFYLQQNAIRDGFSFRDFPRVRRNYILNEDQARAISELVENLRASEYLNYIEPETMTEGFFKIIMEYVRGYIDFLDAIHLRTAIDTKCEYFVTKDGELTKRAQKLVNQKVITEPIQIVGVKGFLEILRRKAPSRRDK